MPLRRPIVLIENDLEDQEIIVDAYNQLNLPFPMKVFERGDQALNFLKDPGITPFIVISDINMPGLNGLQLRDIILADEALYVKCTPYIFLTDSSSLQTATDVYKRSVQGLFTKPSTQKDFESLLAAIMQYWQKAINPVKN